jgi:hypothetical protein
MAQKNTYKVQSWDELERIVDSIDLTKERLVLCGFTFKSMLDYKTKKDFHKIWTLYFCSEDVDFVDEDGK